MVSSLKFSPRCGVDGLSPSRSVLDSTRGSLRGCPLPFPGNFPAAIWWPSWINKKRKRNMSTTTLPRFCFGILLRNRLSCKQPVMEGRKENETRAIVAWCHRNSNTSIALINIVFLTTSGLPLSFPPTLLLVTESHFEHQPGQVTVGRLLYLNKRWFQEPERRDIQITMRQTKRDLLPVPGLRVRMSVKKRQKPSEGTPNTEQGRWDKLKHEIDFWMGVVEPCLRWLNRYWMGTTRHARRNRRYCRNCFIIWAGQWGMCNLILKQCMRSFSFFL